MKKKKVVKKASGRPKLPDNQIKKKRSLRLSDDQVMIIESWGSLQEFVDHHVQALIRLNEVADKLIRRKS